MKTLARWFAWGLLATVPALAANVTVMFAWLDQREAAFWVDTETDAVVTLHAHGEAGQMHVVGPLVLTAGSTSPAELVVTGLMAGQDYDWHLEVNGESSAASGRFTTPPLLEADQTPPDSTLLLGGGLWRPDPPHDGVGPLGEWRPQPQILQKMAATRPDLIIWTGPTSPLRPGDWGNTSGIERRMRHARTNPVSSSLFAAFPQLAVPHPADLGGPRADRWDGRRTEATAHFCEFWPTPSRAPLRDSAAGTLRWNDIEIFLLDIASHREHARTAGPWGQLLGPEQLDWLEARLHSSSARIKLIVASSPLLNPLASGAHLANSPREHRRFLEILRRAGPGIMLASGGRAIGEVNRQARDGTYPLWEISLGPTLGLPGARTTTREMNYYRVPGSLTEGQQFASLRLTGPARARVLALTLYTLDGEAAWTKSLTMSDLGW